MTTITPFLDRSQLSAHAWPNVIDGVEADGGGEETLRDSPAHDIRVASYRNASEADVDAAVSAAQRAFDTSGWPQIPGAEKAALLRRVAARIEAERDELALIETLESGKPISQAKDEVIQLCRDLVLRRHARPARLRGRAQRPRGELSGAHRP